MVVLTALNSTESWRAQALLHAKQVRNFADLDVLVSGSVFPAHRAVLAAHSSRFREIFVADRTCATDANRAFEYEELSKQEICIELACASVETVRTGWNAVYRYCYGLRVPLDTCTALAAVQVSREYRFDELTLVLEAYLRVSDVDPARCTRIFASAVAALRADGPEDSRDVLHFLRAAAWRVMKVRFAAVRDWYLLPWAYMVRLIKLNDLRVASELEVFHAVSNWCVHAAEGDDSLVVGLMKLVRFATMTRSQLSECVGSRVVRAHPNVMRYVRRGLAARDESEEPAALDALDASPVSRRRRMDALTFSNRVAAWSTLSKPVQTSTRYFAGALWRLVIDPTTDGVGLYLAVLSEESHSEVDVCFDFALFIIKHEGQSDGSTLLVRKQANNVRFTRSGQRAGFASIALRSELQDPSSAILRNDTLLIGASIRRRDCASSPAPVPGITLEADDTAEMLMF